MLACHIFACLAQDYHMEEEDEEEEEEEEEAEDGWRDGRNEGGRERGKGCNDVGREGETELWSVLVSCCRVNCCTCLIYSRWHCRAPARGLSSPWTQKPGPKLRMWDPGVKTNDP